MSNIKVARKEIDKVNVSNIESHDDLLAVEEPLEIRLKFMNHNELFEKSIAVTMRTPGNDLELVTGFLYAEGIISSIRQIEKIFHCTQVKSSEEIGNVVVVQLAPSVEFNLNVLNRFFYTSSSCGVCGKSSIEALEFKIPEREEKEIMISRSLVYQLPDLLKKNQLVFGYTGGLHAAGLFSPAGEALFLREDIGRHNALDKVIGAAVADNKIPVFNHVLILSGRVGFELVQKAIMAGVKIVVAIGAPSSLAVKLAETYGLTLVGFVKKDSFNIYSGSQRIID